MVISEPYIYYPEPENIEHQVKKLFDQSIEKCITFRRIDIHQSDTVFIFQNQQVIIYRSSCEGCTFYEKKIGQDGNA